jgi:hypothetical protein
VRVRCYNQNDSEEPIFHSVCKRVPKHATMVRAYFIFWPDRVIYYVCCLDAHGRGHVGTKFPCSISAFFKAEMEYQRALFEAEMTYKTDMFEAEIEYDCDVESGTENVSSETETKNYLTEVNLQTAKFHATMNCKRALFAAEMKLKSRLALLKNVKTNRVRVVNRLQQIAKRFSALKEIATVVEPCLTIETGQSVTPKEQKEVEWDEVSTRT